MVLGTNTYERSSNNFDFLRVFAAICISFTHSYNLLGKANKEPIMQLSGNRFDASFLALCIFFSISGYLIAGSALRSKNIFHFAWKRFLRIQPMLIVVCLLSVFIIGPLYTTLDVDKYFADLQTWSYFRNILPMFGGQFTLPGLFASHPDIGINGSLWTLIVEERLYLFIAATMLLGLHQKYAVWITALGLNALYVGMHAGLIHFLGDFLNSPQFFFALVFIHAAALQHSFSSLKNRGLLFIVLGLAGIISSQFMPVVQDILLAWAIPVFILGMAYIKSFANHAGRYGDFTYGTYIFSFPVQQMLIAHFNLQITPLYLFTLTMLIVLPLSVSSWHLIEKKCLAYKDKLF